MRGETVAPPLTVLQSRRSPGSSERRSDGVQVSCSHRPPRVPNSLESRSSGSPAPPCTLDPFACVWFRSPPIRNLTPVSRRCSSMPVLSRCRGVTCTLKSWRMERSATSIARSKNGGAAERHVVVLGIGPDGAGPDEPVEAQRFTVAIPGHDGRRRRPRAQHCIEPGGRQPVRDVRPQRRP